MTLGVSSPWRLLLIDDNVVDREAIARKLGPRVQLTETATASDGLATLDRGNFECVLLDHRLPDREGIDLLGELGARKVPVVMLTGQGNEALAVEAMKRGASDYLVKDRIERDVLHRAIKGALERSALRRALDARQDELARTVAELRERTTELETSHRALADREARLRVVLEQVPAIVWTCDRDLICTSVSGAGLASAGIDRATWSGQHVATIAATSEAGPEMLDAHRGALRGISGRLEIAMGERLWSCHVGPLEDADGAGVIGVALDVTQGRALDDLKLHSVRLEAEMRQAHEASRLKSEFLANMSHELRTPLNAIIGFGELLEDADQHGAPEHLDYVRNIVSSGRHLLALINDVLDVSKIEAGKLDFYPEPIDVPTFAQEIVSSFQAAAAQKRIELRMSVEPSIRTVVLDPGRLKQIVYNYLSNAVKFTLEGGHVALDIRATDDPSMFRIDVEDSGPGIPTEDVGRLFVEFQQLDVSPAKRHAGTGLGLALTKRLVSAQGGQVGVHSVLGVGTRFHAILPRHHRVASTESRDGG